MGRNPTAFAQVNAVDDPKEEISMKLKVQHSFIPSILALGVVLPLGMAGQALAQAAPPQFPDMTFFVTSKGGPDGANYGGLEGADKHCQILATAAGAGAKTWHAYLSTQALGGAKAVNARDRIGTGPWSNVKGVQIAANLDDLHSLNNKLSLDNSLTETGRKVPGTGFISNQHDILTGSTPEGTAMPADKDVSCTNWTKSGEGTAMIGHSDRQGVPDTPANRVWNNAHLTRGCSAAALLPTGGSGLLYCFAVK